MPKFNIPRGPTGSREPSATETHWDVAAGQKRPRGSFTVNRKPVFPLKFEPDDADQVVWLVVNIDLQGTPFETVRVESVQFTDASSKRTLTVEARERQTTIEWLPGTGDRGQAICAIKTHRLLDGLRANVNQNLVHARVNCRVATPSGAHGKYDKTVSVATTFPLHVILQRLVFVLPGILGSSIWVRRYPVMQQVLGQLQCWPNPVPTQTMNGLGSLECDRAGKPKYEASSLHVVAFPYVKDKNAKPEMYDRELYQELLDGECPPLVLEDDDGSDGKPVRVWHYPVQLYPYDWRWHFDRLLRALIGEDESGENALMKDKEAAELALWNNPTVDRHWSLRTFLGLYGSKQRCQFLHSKAVVAGHSTGGVILNGLVREPGVEAFVDAAYFIASPFHGAYKPFYAFVKGTMDLGTIGPSVLGIEKESLISHCAKFASLAQNLPVLYGLAPSPAYGRVPLARFDDEQGSEEVRAPDVMERVLKLVDTDGNEISRGVTWNRTLAKDALTFHQKCRDTAIRDGIDRCAYYSELVRTGRPTSGSQDGGNPRHTTYGPLRVDLTDSFYLMMNPLERVGYERIAGDGTVPTASLKGPFKGNELCDLELGSVDHAEIVNEESLWIDIRRRLNKRYG